jgi:hypothetical protein
LDANFDKVCDTITPKIEIVISLVPTVDSRYNEVRGTSLIPSLYPEPRYNQSAFIHMLCRGNIVHVQRIVWEGVSVPNKIM